MFYTSLGRLLMVELGEDEEKFEAFMIPLTTAFESLGQVNNAIVKDEFSQKNLESFGFLIFFNSLIFSLENLLT